MGVEWASPDPGPARKLAERASGLRPQGLTASPRAPRPGARRWAPPSPAGTQTGCAEAWARHQPCAAPTAGSAAAQGDAAAGGALHLSAVPGQQAAGSRLPVLLKGQRLRDGQVKNDDLIDFSPHFT